jgi:hypothetical protein
MMSENQMWQVQGYRITWESSKAKNKIKKPESILFRVFVLKTVISRFYKAVMISGESNTSKYGIKKS